MSQWPQRSGSGPLVFAHRGGGGLAPENTLAAFEHGLARGADGLELDVRLSRDGQPVVIHDPTLDRTTDATGPVDRFTATELAGVDAGYRFAADGGFPFRGRRIGVPRLADVLAHCPHVPIIIELKGRDPRLALAAVDVVRHTEARERVCLGGYARVVVRAVRRADPGIATSATRGEVRWALYRSWLGWTRTELPYRAFQVPERAGRTRVVSPRFIRAAHRAGVAVQIWTVDEPDDVRRLLEWGADAIISDRPDVARRVRDEWRASDVDNARSGG